MKSLNTIYLCGPINGCTDEECKDWRELVKTIWDGPTLDPMRRDYRGREHESINQIVEFDKIDVINSDVILVNYDKPSVGTSMEILYAWERGKLVVVVSKHGKQGLSPWLLYHSHEVCTSFEQAVNYVREVLK
ncbi:nucleoside 2-deoxyribosyltransferase [Pseudochrobactrum lubricantis]|uniref:nucleoside 2-deoxyribosyltransferase n=1 Tax=Pseudochrobactrum lubricantis TaxID=558172 RepID=UPI0035DBEB10